MPKRKFKAGDRVAFTDKYGKRQFGDFKEYKMIPTTKGEKEFCVVVAKAFADLGDDTLVNCIVPEHALSTM